jgi:hypothetical protein
MITVKEKPKPVAAVKSSTITKATTKTIKQLNTINFAAITALTKPLSK